MLRALDIRDLLIIDHLELTFDTGLNVLTGETGAGKSILLDALGFVLGWRGRADVVRSGAQQAEVQAVFDLSQNHAVHGILADAGLPIGQDLIMRRLSNRDGRKTAWVNDRRVSGDVLRRLSETLVELHGQHDDRGLLNVAGHRALLDAFAGAEDARKIVHAAWRGVARAETALTQAEAQLAQARADEEYLRHSVTELETIAPEFEEEESLDRQRRLMQGAEKIRGEIARALAVLAGEGAEGQIADAGRWLGAVLPETEGRLDAPLAALERASLELGDAVSGIEMCLEALDFDPENLERVEERLFALRGLARKHGVAPDELPSFADDLRTRLDRIVASDSMLKTLRRDLASARANYNAVAMVLSDTRRAAASQLDAAMAQELAPLKMERARFKTRIAEVAPGPEGIDAVEFEVATNPGAPAGPLNKIASGGELSRFLLALKVCLAGDEGASTLIFDEIDRGVGGGTAAAVGRRLADLARVRQVLVVTHSPQVAACGAHHWRVEKRIEADQTLSRVIPLDQAGRIDELARMLAGDQITEAARGAARALIQDLNAQLRADG